MSLSVIELSPKNAVRLRSHHTTDNKFTQSTTKVDLFYKDDENEGNPHVHKQIDKFDFETGIALAEDGTLYHIQDKEAIISFSCAFLTTRELETEQYPEAADPFDESFEDVEPEIVERHWIQEKDITILNYKTLQEASISTDSGTIEFKTAEGETVSADIISVYVHRDIAMDTKEEILSQAENEAKKDNPEQSEEVSEEQKIIEEKAKQSDLSGEHIEGMSMAMYIVNKDTGEKQMVVVDESSLDYNFLTKTLGADIEESQEIETQLNDAISSLETTLINNNDITRLGDKFMPTPYTLEKVTIEEVDGQKLIVGYAPTLSSDDPPVIKESKTSFPIDKTEAIKSKGGIYLVNAFDSYFVNSSEEATVSILFKKICDEKELQSIRTMQTTDVKDGEYKKLPMVSEIESLGVTSNIIWEKDAKAPTVTYTIGDRQVDVENVEQNIYLSETNGIIVMPIKKDGKFTGANKVLITQDSKIQESTEKCSFPAEDNPTLVYIESRGEITPDVIDYRNRMVFVEGTVYHFENDAAPKATGDFNLGADASHLFINPASNEISRFLEGNILDGESTLDGWDVKLKDGKLYLTSESGLETELKSINRDGTSIIAETESETFTLGQPSNQENPNSPWKNSTASMKEVIEQVDGGIDSVAQKINDYSAVTLVDITPTQLVRDMPPKCFVLLETEAFDQNGDPVYSLGYKTRDRVYVDGEQMALNDVHSRIEKGFITDTITTCELLQKIQDGEHMDIIMNGEESFTMGEFDGDTFSMESYVNATGTFDRDFARDAAEVSPLEL